MTDGAVKNGIRQRNSTREVTWASEDWGMQLVMGWSYS
jgi:hypothetical protein